jgi:predicted oxidoreductase
LFVGVRFTGENRERDQRLVDTLQKLSAEKRGTPSQLAIAWALAKSKSIVSVIGARTRGREGAKGPRCGAHAARDGQSNPRKA